MTFRLTTSALLPLPKADTVPLERDRQKVIVQITQNLSSRIRNKHAFELPSLYIPDKSSTGSRYEGDMGRYGEISLYISRTSPRWAAPPTPPTGPNPHTTRFGTMEVWD